MKRPHFVAAVILFCGQACSAVELKQDTVEAFDHYVAAVEQRLRPQFSGDHFLWFDDSPELRQKLLNSAVIVQPGQGNGVAPIRDGLIQDWIGGVFVPGVNLKTVLSVVQDYDHHGEMYKPQVTDAKMQSHIGNTFLVYMRIVKAKFFLTDVLNSDHEIHYFSVDSKRAYSLSYSKRIAEVTDAGKPGEHELPVGRDRGFLWRLYSYWFFEERDGGVYITCQSVTLTRDIPALMAKVLGPILRELPGESLRTGLEQTRRAALGAK